MSLNYSMELAGHRPVIDLCVKDEPTDVSERAGFLIDVFTPLHGSHPASPDKDGHIRRELAPDADPVLVEGLLLKMGAIATASAK